MLSSTGRRTRNTAKATTETGAVLLRGAQQTVFCRLFDGFCKGYFSPLLLCAGDLTRDLLVPDRQVAVATSATRSAVGQLAARAVTTTLNETPTAIATNVAATAIPVQRVRLRARGAAQCDCVPMRPPAQPILEALVALFLTCSCAAPTNRHVATAAARAGVSASVDVAASTGAVTVPVRTVAFSAGGQLVLLY